MRKPIPRAIIILSSCCIAYLLIAGAFASVFYGRAAYEPVPQDLWNEHAQLISFLAGPPFTQSNLPFLTENEASHISDVKRILDVAYALHVLALGTLIGIIAAFWKVKEQLFVQSLRAAGWGILALCVFLGAAYFLNFSALFTLMHVILFPQGNWIFPADSILIRMYPASFFAGFTASWLWRTLAFGVVALAAGMLLKAPKRKQQHRTRTTSY